MDGGYRYWHGASNGPAGRLDKTIINRVMLGFRPIAPKPATGGSGLLTDNPFVSKRRKKRKYVRVRKNNIDCRKRKKMVPEEEFIDGRLDSTVLTLQLLPERAQNKDLESGSSWAKVDPPGDHEVTVEDTHDLDLQMWMNDNKWVIGSLDRGVGSDHTVVMPQIGSVAESWVTVESVTDTCMDDVRELGYTDAERIKNLERDTCPGFISEGLDRVQWVNEAYKRLVRQDSDGHSRECTVRLVVNENLPNVLYKAFTGRVRLQHTWRNKNCSKVMPCDVWRMNSGGFAWRLDVESALSLGLN